MLITGPTGVGKTWLACALAHKACREGYTAQYVRLTRLLRELTIAKGDGQYAKLLTNLAIGNPRRATSRNSWWRVPPAGRRPGHLPRPP